jgi:hypothetical protein
VGSLVAPAENLPDPLIAGPDFPSLFLRMHKGKQLTASRTNLNLRTTADHFNESGTFTMATLLGYMLDFCEAAHAEGEGWCPLVSRWEFFEDEETGEPYEG